MSGLFEWLGGTVFGRMVIDFRRLYSGETLVRLDTRLSRLWQGTFSVQLRHSTRWSEFYVIVSTTELGRTPHVALTAAEFVWFAHNVARLRDELHAAQRDVVLAGVGEDSTVRLGPGWLPAEVLRQIDTLIRDGWDTLSLRLMHRAGSAPYVDLVRPAAYWLVLFTAEEFEHFAADVKSIRDKLPPASYPPVQWES